ncbi:MAG: nuclear transport factor 2 family protein [Kofleriaceae bacterium]
MTATEHNRQLIEGVYAELALDNSAPFVAALADDVRWTIRGHSVWSRSFEGKPAVLGELLGTVRVQLTSRVRLSVRRILADGDHVIVEATGQATAKTGQPYNNEYCFLYRLVDGKVAEITEYLDTQLACTVLAAPWAAPAAS